MICIATNYHKNNPEKEKNRKKIWRANNHWAYILYSARQRCNNSNVVNYKYYGGRGIKCLLTRDNIKYLWFRDNVYSMDRPCLHRKNNNGSYTLENCEFIEFYEHQKYHKKEK